MANSLQKALLALIAFSLSYIATELFPISRQAMYWNRCLDNTISWIDETKDFSEWEQKAKESLAVGVCNGAVYEPKLRTHKTSK